MFEARDKQIGSRERKARRVAVKILNPPSGSPDPGDPSGAESFKREVAALVRLGRETRGVVQILDSSVNESSTDNGTAAIADGTRWLAMEWIDGRTLREELDADGPMQRERFTLFALSLLEAISRMHAAGVVHRDLKPSNVMLRADGSAAIIDFGIALPEGWDAYRTATGVKGTVAYMPPEQMTGSRAASVDIYSAGILLHEAITGEHPILGRDLPKKMGFDDLNRLRVSPPAALPPAWSAVQPVLRRAIEKDPAERWPGADEFRRALAAALVKTESAGSSPAPQPSTHRVRRIFVRCGDRTLPDESWGTVTLPKVIDATHIPDAIREVRAALAGAQDAEVLIAGPLCLAVALGQALAHEPVSIDYVQLNQHTKRFETWTNNRDDV